MSSRHRRRGALIGIAGAVVAACVVAAPMAGAAPRQPENCALNTNTGQQACFPTFTAAEAFATGGAVTDAPADARTALREFRPRGDIKQGTFYDEKDFGGGAFIVTGDGLCDGSDGVINYQFDFPDDWKNRISSVQPWGSCKIWLYPEPGLGGDRDGPFTGNTGYIGDYMNDRTQSVGFS